MHSALLLSKSHHVVHKKVTAADRMMAKGQALVKTGLFCIKLSDVMFFFFFFSRLRFTHAKNSQSMYNKGQLIQRRETLNAITGHSSALVKHLWVYLMYYWCILNIPTTK